MASPVSDKLDPHCMTGSQLREHLGISLFDFVMLQRDGMPCILGPDGQPPTHVRDLRYDVDMLIEWFQQNPIEQES
ncbi:hypothetical protein [Devosia sp. A449]